MLVIKKQVLAFTLFCALILGLTVVSPSQERGVTYHTESQIKAKYPNCFDSTKIRDCERAAEDLSLIGLHREAIAAFNICHPQTYSSPEEAGRLASCYKTIPAHKYILQEAKDRKVVMINENHSSSHHRVFTASLLKGLKKQGFTHLGLEALRDVSILTKKGYPTQKAGHYIADPQYANMIRIAMDLGFVIFGYDVFQGSIIERELAQAKKIAQVLQENPTAKIVIHAGGGHIREDTVYYGGLMAYQFKKLTGIDPLTINQTRMNEQSHTDYEHFFYKQLKQLHYPSILVEKKSKVLYKDSATDLILFHPRTTYKNERPSWLYNNKNYYSKEYVLDSSLIFPILILVFPKQETDTFTVPVDAIELKTKLNKITLFVPKKGAYEVVIQTTDKKINTTNFQIN